MKKFLPLLAAAVVCLSTVAARADIISASGTATITASALGPGVLGSTTGAVPFRPGSLVLGPVGATGMVAFMANTHWYEPFGNAKVYAPHPSIVGTTNQASQMADATAAGELTIESLFSVDFTIDAGGTPIQIVSLAYGVGGLIGPAGGLARFDSTITYSHSVSGVLGSLVLSYTNSTPGPFSDGVADILILPALGPGTLTLSGNIRIRADDEPGDGIVTEIGAFAVSVPEPSTWVLLGLTSLSVCGFGYWRKRRGLAKGESVLLSPAD
jgi:hypothetical protein